MTELSRLSRRISEHVRFDQDDSLRIDEGTSRAIDDVVVPAIADFGGAAVLAELKASRSDPAVATVLSWLIGDESIGLPLFLATDVFSDDEIVQNALAYLQPTANREAAWAWALLLNHGNGMDVEAHARLLKRVITEMPDRDDALWLLGDGPLSSLQGTEVGKRIVEEWEREIPKVQRMRKLLEAK